MILQVSVREIHIDRLKKHSTEFAMTYGEKRLVRIGDFTLRLIIPAQLLNMKQRH